MPGLITLIVKRINGTLHALVQARVDVGHLNVAEPAPTVHCRPAVHTGSEDVSRDYAWLTFSRLTS